MTLYDPLPTVTIGGVDYTSDTINAVQATSGRLTVDEQPRPGYATISLLVVDGTYPAIEINQFAVINVKDSSGFTSPIFSGYVTDVTRRITNHGVNGTEVTVDVTLAGPLTRLNRVSTAASYPKEFDGDRINQILLDFESTSWNEVNSLTTWATVDPALTWLTYDPDTFVGTVDTPGSYEITAYSGGTTNAYAHAQQVASSALGVIWEDQQGRINYSDAASRINDVAQNGFTMIDAAYLQARGLAAKTSSGDLINDMTVTYKTSASETAEDAFSKSVYGVFAGQKTTLLENKVDAEAMADLYIKTRAYPRNIMESVTIPLHNPDLPNALRDALINAYIGKPVSIPNPPSSILDSPFSGFLEGVTYAVSQKAASITVYLSSYALSQIEQAWQQVDPAERWNTVSAILTWENAEVIV